MPFAALCRKCKLEKHGKGDDSHAYMIVLDFFDIKAEISKHFKNIHGSLPKPSPDSLSFRNDFTIEEVELAQYGGDGSLYHLTFTFTTHQFSSDDYKISVITHHHYDECVRKTKNKRPPGRIDLELYEYF